MTGTDTPADPAVTRIVEAYEEAFNTNDAQAMNALFCEDATFVNFSGRLVAGREKLRHAQEFVFADDGPLADVAVSYQVEHASVLTADTMIVHARQRTHGHTAGLDPMHAVLTLVICREDGGWRIRMGQNTPADA